MTGNEAFVKVVGLIVLGGIAQKVLTVIAPRTVEAVRAPLRSATDAAVAVAKDKLTS